LIHEAGGVMTALSGQSLAYNCAEPVHGTLLAAGRSRHAALVALARDRLAEFG
jgi:myo-inositol-1(or 4)-monophosphatase